MTDISWASSECHSMIAHAKGSGVFFRRGGKMIEISREEWDRIKAENQEAEKKYDQEQEEERELARISLLRSMRKAKPR